MTFTAGFVWWLTRSGGLITTMLMGVPAWRHVDLLPVLARSNDEAEDDDDRGDDSDDDSGGNFDTSSTPTDHEDSAVAELFEAEVSARHSVIR
ncbi:hypothetical protein [Methylibium sp.]|uniref:hypothetical protein n=1 Tax=Methylibium sp. TaxID=2067992 RepID=UPI002600827B|nr:hypothetical protein [Methylibium sp.]